MRFRVRPVTRLAGIARVPGDKSISHRAALLGALAEGQTDVMGYLEADDCLRTIAAVQALGADVTHKGPGHFRIGGVGRTGLHEPDDVLDCGNSGTTARLLLGVLAGQRLFAALTGDASLRRRPMARVTTPLQTMGASFLGRADGTKLPLAVRGTRPLRGIRYESPIASAQVKSAILLAGLGADSTVSVTEPVPSRDHSERMLRLFGARVETRDTTITLEPGPLQGTTVQVPGDISSAAFLLVAGALVTGAHLTVEGVGVNETRAGILDVLATMGAPVMQAAGSGAGEPLADLAISASDLVATEISGGLVPRLIDEVPIIAVAAAAARGRTVIRDAAELRVKESDRLAAIAREFGRMGVRVEELSDGLAIAGPQRFHGGAVTSGGDHRMAMALTIAGLCADAETTIEDTECVATSFPEFVATVNALTEADAVVVEVE